ncbi:MAG: hypothetical protein AAFQ82_08560, partial [Myxococcota bacterium]
ELPKRLSSPELGGWWLEAVVTALGASGGEIRSKDKGVEFEFGAPASGDGFLVTISPDVSVWLAGASELDPGSTQLLTAMGETVGVMLDSQRLLQRR